MFSRIAAVVAAAVAACRRTSTLRVARLMAINQGHSAGETHCEDFRPDGGIEPALIRAAAWDSPTIEARYELHGAKYRIVYRPDDTVLEYPPRKAFGFVRAPRLVKATLVRDADERDVTGRVRKYMGPERDFHAGKSTRLRLWDMFPFEDHEHEAAHTHRLELVTVAGDGQRTVTRYDYRSNPRMTTASGRSP